MARSLNRDSRWWSWVIALALAALAVGVHLEILGHDLTNYDDPIDLDRKHPWLPRGLVPGAIGWAFTSLEHANWFPLTRISWLLDVSLLGFSPRSFFLGNLVYHALASVLLFAALRAMTGALARSALVAAIFAVHPLGVESVAWAAERKDVLCGAAWMATLLAYAGWVRRPSILRTASVFGLTAAALLAKPMAVTLPFALLLLDVWPLQRVRVGSFSAARETLVRPILEKLPLFALVVISSVVTIHAQRAGGAVEELDSLPLAARLANAVISYWIYVAKFVWPSGLAVLYPHPRHAVSYAGAAIGAIALLVVTALALRGSKQRPWLTAGWLWFLGILVPVIGLVQVGLQPRADRYMYLPRIGLSVLAVWGGAELSTRLRLSASVRAMLAAVVVSGLGATSVVQVRHWQNTVTLFTHAIAVTGGTPTAHKNLAQHLVHKNDLEGAQHHLEELLRLRPNLAAAHRDYAGVLLQRGRTADALLELRRAVELDPQLEPIRIAAYRALAESETPADVIAVSLDELRVQPESVEIRVRLARAYLRDGRTADAIETYRAVLQRQSSAPEIENNLAWILATDADPALRDPKEAVRLAESAVAQHGRRDAGSLDTLAVAYAAAGRSREALAVAREALARAESGGDPEVIAGIRERIAELSGERADRMPPSSHSPR